MGLTEGASTDVAIAFLKAARPDGLWAITAIRPDKKSIVTRTFTQEQDAREFVDQYNKQWNLYWTVNKTRPGLSQKADKSDVERADFLHVDVDPREGEDVEAERDRIIALLTKRRPEGVPEPTFIVFSGGGINAFWRIDPPFEVDGDPEKILEIEDRNRFIEKTLGGDHCHNVDRIMRLPGTLNIPDAKKAARGRTPEVAHVLHQSDAAYKLDAFKRLSRATDGPSPAGGREVHIPGNVERLTGVDDLDKWEVPDRVKALVVQGHLRDVEGPKKVDDSRSGWLFDAICGLVRAGVPDAVIYSIITDPDFRISESVIDKGSRVDAYAKRQIGRAHDEAVDPDLRALNDQFAVILNYGGKCVVVEEIHDRYLDRTSLAKQTFDHFKNRMLNKTKIMRVGDKNVSVPKGKWWLHHKERREYHRVVFSPSGDIPHTYNLWRGFAVDPHPGDCSKFLGHVFDHLCGGDQTLYDYLLKWMARVVQKPATRGETAVVLRGGQGIGKGAFAYGFGSLFGRHFLQVSQPQHLVGNFNVHLRDCLVLFADEAFFAGDKRHESVLKTLITEAMMMHEAKGIDVEQGSNFTHIIMSSNNDWVVPAGAHERRYFILDVKDTRQQDTNYFGAIKEELDKGGREALLHHLMNVDLEGFQVRNVPRTAALRDQRAHSLTSVEEWWYQRLLDGAPTARAPAWEEVSTAEIMADYASHCRRFSVFRPLSATAVGSFLKKVLPGLKRVRRRIAVPGDDGRDRMTLTWCYEIPPLEEARGVFARRVLGDPDHDWGPDPQTVDLDFSDDGRPPF